MNSGPVPYASVCSGHCAVTQGLKGRGWTPQFFAEVEAFPCGVLGQRFGATAPQIMIDPAAMPAKERKSWIGNNKELGRMSGWSFGDSIPNLGDFTKIDAREWPGVEWLWGGTPCQTFSIAGGRAGLKDHRGNLTVAFLDLAHELAAVGYLRGFTWENVPGILSHKANPFGCFLAAAVGHDAPIVSPHRKGRWSNSGVVVGPRARLAWRILDTQHFGLPQRRRRLFVVCSFRNGPDPVQILLERQGVCGPVAQGSREGEGFTHDLAPSLTASGRGVARIGDPRGQDPVGDHRILQPVLYSAMPMNSGRDFTDREVPVAQPVMAAGQAHGDQGGDFVLQPVAYAPDLAPTLRAEGFDASEDGTGRQALVDHQGLRMVDITNLRLQAVSGTLEAAQDRGNRGQGVLHPLAFGGNNTSGPIDVATARSAHAVPHGRLDFETETFIAEPVGFAEYVETGLVGTLRAKGADCGAGSEALIAFTCKDYGGDAGSVKPTLRAMGHGETWPNAGGQVAVAFSVRGRDDGAQAEAEPDDVTSAVRTGTGGSSKSFVATIGHNIRWAVRRLTPIEAERLQGTADNFTRIRWRGRPEEDCPDGPRYKVIGNSMSVDVVVWLGDRIHKALRP